MASVEQLFEVAVPEAEGDAAAVGTTARGAASEFDVIARLLRRGHKVAVPVVDDDGVDLIVDYRTLVQVKHTGLCNAQTGYPLLCPGRLIRRHRGEPQRWRSLAAHVDVVVIEAVGVGWWVVPRAVIGNRRSLSLGPSMDQWRDAWSVFDAAR